MRGDVRRPVHSTVAEGRAATLVVLLVILALLAGCGGAAPSSGATASGGAGTSGAPGESGAPGGPAGPGSSPSAPIETPTPSAEPDGAWIQGVQLPPARAVASLEPTREARAGVLADTAFRLRALDGSDPVDLAAGLVADPPLDLRVTRQGDAAIVTPAGPLADGQRYRLSLVGADGTVRATWAVQAIAPLEVSSTTPGDESTDVPLRTGIEVAFNQYGVDLADAERFIEIRPAVAGHFEQEGRTVAFVPDRPLEPATIYAVTVRKGLPLAGTDEVLAADEVVRFETAGSGAPQLYFWIHNDLLEVRPAELAVIAAGYERYDDEDDEEEDPDASQAPEPAIPDRVAVDVHRLRGMAGAVDAWRSLQAVTSWAVHDTDPGVPTDGLQVAWEGMLPIEELETGSDDEDDEEEATTAVRLPVALDPGWYLVTFRPEGTPRQLVLQVTDLAVYTLVTTTRSAAWVNDLATGQPVEAATAVLDGSRLGLTDAEGVVTGPTPRRVAKGATSDGERAASVLEVRAGGRGVFVPAAAFGCEKCEDERVDQPWLVVFQSDRWEYRPTDTISTWGMVQRKSSGSIPASAEVRLATWSDAIAEGTVLETRAVTPDGNGVFAARIPVEDLPYGEYRLQLWVNDALVSDRGISVAVIEKPAWTLRVGTSHRAVVDGGTVRATATATFFEGTPVAGVQLKLGSGSGSIVTTSQAGTASRRVTLRFAGGEDWEDWGSGQWDVREIGARPRLPEESEMYADARVAVFRASVILRSGAILAGDRVVVSGTVHDVALARFDRSDEPWFDEVDPFGQVRADQRVRVRTVEHIYRTRQTGTTYDWVLKQTVPVYTTTETTRDLGTRSIRSDGDGRFRVTFPATDGDRSYEVTVRTTDGQGRETLEQHWASAPAMIREDRAAEIETDVPDDGASIGDTVHLRFTGGLTGGSGARYLWLRSREGLQAAAVTSRPRYAFTFRGSDVPNVVIHAVRFNGRGYEPASWEAWVPFRVADRGLRITVTPDRKRYEPGDRASLAIRAVDVSGRPVSTSVYLGVLDEKLVSMGIVSLEDPLESLYEYVGGGVVGLAWTHRGSTRDDGGGMDTGGGGDGDWSEAPRTDFRDWLVARIVRTGADGVARVTFDLSDDLTSWHAFALGIGRSLRAGEGEALLPVSLPLFADVTLAESYLVADRPIVRLRAFGTALDASDTVTYRVTSDTLAMTPVTVTARGAGAADVALPPLTAGTHRLRVDARTGSGDRARRDTLVRTFEVVASRVTQSTLTSAALDGPLAVPGGKGFTSLVLADAGRGRVLPLLEELVDGIGSVRGDQVLAAGIAERALRDGFGIEPWRGAIDADIDQWLGEEGLSIMTYGGDELELGALAALSGDPRAGGLREYFRWAEPSTREERIWVLAGRAAMGDAVLPDIRALARASGLPVPERVVLANAALAAGDEDLAGRLLRDILATAGEQRGRWVRLTDGRTADEPIVLTARLAIVAASLGEPVAAQMDAYLDENAPKRTVVDLERAIAAQGWVRRVPAGSAAAVLAVGSRRSELRIEDSEAIAVQLTPAQAAEARLEPVSGSVVVSIRVDQPLDAASLRAPKWLDPVRTVTPSGRIGIADTVVVLITVHRPPDDGSGCLVVRDVAPSGLVPVMGYSYADEEEEEGPTSWGPERILGQVVEFCVGTGETANSRVTLRYAARIISPGSYRWEPTVFQLSDTPEAGTVIPATRIVISATE